MDSQTGTVSPVGGMDQRLGLDALRESPAFRGPVEPIDDHDHANGHFALVYETLDERLAATVPFVRQGLDRGEQCVYVVDGPAERAATVDALAERGVAVDEALDSGALTFSTVEEVYFQTGTFDPERVLSFYTDFVEGALDEYEGVRVVAGTDWIDEVPFETFMEYEGRVNALFDEYDAMAICHYDRTTLPSDVIRDVVRTHPHLIYDDSVSHNFYYTPPDELHDGDASEADRLLATLQDRTEAKAALAEHERFLRELNEIMAGRDRSFAAKLRALFELGREQFGVAVGGLNRVDADADRFEIESLAGDDAALEPGLELPLSETYCRASVESRATTSISDPASDGFGEIAMYEDYGIEAYLGTHVPIADGDDRTLTFLASEPRSEPFSPEDRAYVEMMGQWVQYELERKQRVERLERSRERFRRVFENSQDAIFINDPRADELLAANPAGCEMLGYDRAEVLARRPSDFHPEEMERFREFVDGVYETGTGWTNELTCLHRNGERIPVEMSASTIEYDGRQCMLAIARDISERRERERDLERTERQFEATFNNPVSYMGLLDTDGTVRRVNENARQSVGVTNEEIAGEKFWETPWFADSETVQANVRDAVARAAAGEYVQAEIPHRSPDGETIVVDAMLEPVRDDGEVVTILASGHDITERVRHEDALEAAYEIITDPGRSFDEQVDALLELGRDVLGVEYATLSRIHERTGDYVFERVAAPDEADLELGATTALEATNCERVVTTKENLVLRDVADDAPKLADRTGNAEWGISCYIGTPVAVDDGVYGTFCFYDMDARSEAFSDWEVAFVDLLGNWIGSELERQRDTDRLAALNNLNAVARNINRALADQSTRSEIEQVVCEHLATSDSYEFAWLGTVDEATSEIVPSTAVDTDGYLDEATVTADDSLTGRGPAGRAVRTGQTQVVQDVEEAPEFSPWREAARERGIRSSAAVPIVYEDRTYGVLNVYSARKNAFDEAERAVVTQLGEMVGLTIAAVENERRYRTLAENIPNGSVALFDTDGRYLTAAGTIYDDLSIDSDALEGTHVTEVDALTSEMATRIEDAIHTVSDGEAHSTRIEYEGLVLDVQFLPIRDDSGTVTAVLALTQDITERRDLERTYQNVFEHTSDGLVVLDPETGEICKVNEQFCAMTGYERATLVGATADLVTDPDGQYSLEEAPRRAQRARDDGSALFEWRTQRSDGTTLPVEVHLSVATIEGEERVLASVRDISERKERAAQLQHERERLELINRLLRHNLLNGLNLVDARLDRLDGRVDFEAIDDLDTATTRTDEMIDLIETLRSLTERLIGDDYELEPVDLGAVLRAELDRARTAYEEATFETRAPLDDAPAVLADDLLEEVVENLLVNAVRHNDSPDPQVAVDVDVTPESATVHVIDDGPGIPAEMREIIFEKGKKRFESPGTGFGLHLVREIVDVYDGTIEVRDRDPEGSIFSITLPRAESDA